MAKKNVADKVVDDSTQLNISVKAVKWILGILISSVLGILGFAWGLYISVSGDLDSLSTNMQLQMSTDKKEILSKLENLEEKKVDKNAKINNDQDVVIGIVFDRTNSRSASVNSNSVRPTNTSNLPPSINRDN